MVDVESARAQMGAGAVALLAVEGSSVEIGSGCWRALSGLPSAGSNIALIHQANDDVLSDVLAEIEKCDRPTMLFLAGSAKTLGTRLPTGWVAVGALPIMTVDLTGTPPSADGRVRRALLADASTITELMSAAYEQLDPAEVRVMVDHVVSVELPVEFWLLENGDQAVSAVMTHRIQSAVSLWCMATPPRFARRGFGRSLLAAVLAWAQADGATIGLLGATPAGEPFYRATGWTVLESWDTHLNAPSAQRPLWLQTSG
jgi:GNAT superfamily N-acetyltransferase